MVTGPPFNQYLCFDIDIDDKKQNYHKYLRAIMYCQKKALNRNN